LAVVFGALMSLFDINMRFVLVGAMAIGSGAIIGRPRGTLLLLFLLVLVWLVFIALYSWFHLLRHAPNTCAVVASSAVVGIFSLSLTLLAIQKSVESSRRTKCIYELKEMGMKLHNERDLTRKPESELFSADAFLMDSELQKRLQLQD